MNFIGNSGRMRGSSRQNSSGNSHNYTFQKNLKTPSFQRRFVPPEPKSNINYGMAQTMRTPMLNIENTGYFEVAGEPYVEKNFSAVKTDMMNEGYGFGDFDEYEFEPTVRNGNSFKRKNPFPYSKNEDMDFQTNRNLYSVGSKGSPNSLINMDPQTPNNRLRQSVLCTDTPAGLGYKASPKETPKLSFNIPPQWSPSDSQTPFKGKLDKNSNPSYPRLFTVNIEKLLSWPKTLSCGKIIFELFGILEKIWDIKASKAKKIQLKSQRSTARVTCTFYEIDRSTPQLKLGQWIRCIVLLRCTEEIQCLSIRPASANELKFMDKMLIDSSKMMAKVLLQK